MIVCDRGNGDVRRASSALHDLPVVGFFSTMTVAFIWFLLERDCQVHAGSWILVFLPDVLDAGSW